MKVDMWLKADAAERQKPELGDQMMLAIIDLWAMVLLSIAKMKVR